MEKEDKFVSYLFALATAFPVGFAMFLTTTNQMSSGTLILFSLLAGIYSTQVYLAFHLHKVEARLFNITQKKDSEEDSEEEDEPEKES